MSDSASEVAAKPRKHVIIRPGDTQSLSLEQKRLMITSEWPLHQSWPFKLGIPSLGLLSAANVALLNKTIRSSLYIQRYGRFTSYIALSSFSAILSSTLHTLLVTGPILRQTTTKLECPICLQVRAGIAHFVGGIILPSIAVPVISFPIASSLKIGYYFPKIHKEPYKVYELAKELLQPVRQKFVAFAFIQVIWAMGMAYAEENFFLKYILPL